MYCRRASNRLPQAFAAIMSGASRLVPAAVTRVLARSCGDSEISYGREPSIQASSSANNLVIFEDFAPRKAHLLELCFPFPNRCFITFAHFPDYVPITNLFSCSVANRDQYQPFVAVCHVPSSTKLRLSPHQLNNPLWLKSLQRLLM